MDNGGKVRGAHWAVNVRWTVEGGLKIFMVGCELCRETDIGLRATRNTAKTTVPHKPKNPSPSHRELRQPEPKHNKTDPTTDAIEASADAMFG